MQGFQDLITMAIRQYATHTWLTPCIEEKMNNGQLANYLTKTFVKQFISFRAVCQDGAR